ncbi:spectrin binding protein [Aureococcus anophagefferens]|uniref:Spectrin binding protein n=1 Tax=Aureococcus anophagefferens TaxID=44056 RepID=A0ABR1G5K5_AURAN
MGETSDKENEQNEKERKKEMAEFRKIAKQLKAKDAQTKLGAIAKCGENAESLRRGECFVPLLQLCVAKKKNAAIVAAAVGCVRASSGDGGTGEPGDDGEVSPPSHAHARLLLEAAEKKKNRVPGGKLFTDLLSHENPDIVGGARRVRARRVRAGAGRVEEVRRPAAAATRCRRRRRRDAVVTLAKRLAETSDAAAGPPRELLHCLNIVERLLVAIAAAEPPPPTTAPLRRRRCRGRAGPRAGAGAGRRRGRRGADAVRLPELRQDDGRALRALKFFGDAAGRAVPEGLGDCVALVCKCLDRSVDAFKEDAYRRLTASPEAAVPATLLKVLAAPGRAGEMRFSDAEGGATLPPPAEGDDAPRTATPRDGALAIAAALAVDDADGKYRAIRFAAKLSDRRENALILTPVVAPLLAVVEAWAADARAPWPTGISNEAGAALALDGLIAIAGSSAGAWAELADDAALAVLDAARARAPADAAGFRARRARARGGRGGRRRRAGPGARARGGGEPAGEAPPAAGAARAAVGEQRREKRAPRRAAPSPTRRRSGPRARASARRRADDEPKKDDKKKGKKDDKKAKDKGRKSVVEKAAEENPDEPPPGADYDGRDAKLANALLYALVAPDGAALDNALDGAREATDRGATPATLELAGDAAFVAELLEAGADVNAFAQGGRGRTWPTRAAACRCTLRGFRCGVEGMGAVFEALLAAGATRPRGTATYDNARAGTSRAAKMRATVGGVLDRAFAVASRRPAGLPPAGAGPRPHGAALRLADDDAVAVARRAPPPDPSAGLVLESPAPAPAAPEVVTFDIFDTVPSTDDLGPLPPAPAASAGPAPAGEHAAPARRGAGHARTGDDTVGSASNGGRVYTQALPELPPTARRVLAPIHVAVRSHAVGVVDWLLDARAPRTPVPKPNLQPDFNVNPAGCHPSPLALAALTGAEPEVVEALLERGESASALADDLGGTSPAHAAAARGHAHTVVAMDVGDALDKNGRTTAMVAALAGRDDTVEELLDHGVHAYVRDCGGMNLLDVAIDLAEVDVATSIIQHAYVQVYERDVRRAERVHCFWADKAMAVTRDDRAASHEAEKLAAATAVLKLVLRACWAHLEASRHIKPCFADGVMYYDVLLAEEQKAIDEAEQEHAARSIQFAIKRRNKKKAKGKGGAKKKNRKSSSA